MDNRDNMENVDNMENKKDPTKISQDIINNLSGTRLQIVQSLIKNENHTLGVRDIQRELKLSSVSLADYHLTKLIEMKLVEKTNTNKYRLIQLLPVGEFKDHLLINKKLIPKHSFYLAFLSTFLIASIVLLVFGLWEVLIISFFLFEFFIVSKEIIEIFRRGRKKSN